jgi:DNA-binding transcriptional MerR regulator
LDSRTLLVWIALLSDVKEVSMKLSRLSAATGVPVATVKYYLREGLLPPGERVSATRAEYSPEHGERLRLIRALVEGAGMSIAGVRRVVEAIEHPPTSRHEFLGAAQSAIVADSPTTVVSSTTRYAVQQLGWESSAHPDLMSMLQSGIDTADRASFPLPIERLVGYGRAMEKVAEIDIDSLDTDTHGSGPAEALRYVAVGTVVVDPILIALRRLAQAHVSAGRFGAQPLPDGSATRH